MERTALRSQSLVLLFFAVICWCCSRCIAEVLPTSQSTRISKHSNPFGSTEHFWNDDPDSETPSALAITLSTQNIASEEVISHARQSLSDDNSVPNDRLSNPSIDCISDCQSDSTMQWRSDEIPEPAQPFLFYQIPDGSIFGPFPEQQVIDWYFAGYFTEHLLISPDPEQYPFSPLRDLLYYRSQPLCAYQLPVSYRAQHPSFLTQLRAKTAALSNWIAQQRSPSSLATPNVQETASQLSSLVADSKEMVKKQLKDLSRLPKKATKLVPNHWKRLLPFTARSRYQDAQLDALWSRKNRRIPSETGYTQVASSLNQLPSEGGSQDTADEEDNNVAVGDFFLFSSAVADAPSQDRLDETDINVSHPPSEVDISTTATPPPFRNNPLLSRPFAFDSPDKPKRSLLSQILPSWTPLRSLKSYKSDAKTNDVLHLWSLHDQPQPPALPSHPPSYPASSLSTPPSTRQFIAKKLWVGVLLLLQAISWALLLQQLVSDVDWTIWSGRYEDLLHHILLMDVRDVGVLTRRVWRLLRDKMWTLLDVVTAGPLWHNSLWLENLRSWFVHTENIAVFGIWVSSILLGFVPAASTGLVSASSIGVLGFLLMLLHTKVLTSLEVTSGAAAWSIGSSQLADRHLSPGLVLILRVTGVVRKLQLLWWTLVVQLLLRWLFRKPPSSAIPLSASVPTYNRQPWERSHREGPRGPPQSNTDE